MNEKKAVLNNLSFFNFNVRILFYFQILYGLARIRNRYKCTINPLARLGSGYSLLARESESIRLQDGRVCTNIFRCTPSIISANPYIFVGIRSYILISTEKELVWCFINQIGCCNPALSLQINLNLIREKEFSSAYRLLFLRLL